jgi:hypothetical protein
MSILPALRSRARSGLRRRALLWTTLFAVLAAVGCGGSETPTAGSPEGAGSSWDQMSWDQGSWS